MTDQPKLERLLRLMKLLTGNINYSIAQLSERLNISERTVYRYIETFRDAGFVIKNKGDIYKLDKSSPQFKDIANLLHFNEEESHILKKAIDSIDENNLLKQNLKRKLGTVYDYKILAETVVKGKNADNINKISEAIEEKKQICLLNYNSANSNSTSDRIVEAFAFTTNYIQIWAFEPESGQNKLFKVSRIGDISLCSQNWQHEQKHKTGFIDIFRISSYVQMSVKLKLSVRAMSLLVEEYPLAERDISKIDNSEWMLDTNVCSYEGIGRFVIGLYDEIKIIDSIEFELFIENKIKNF
ncbi:MAG: HTH domain-containing protein [Bacteroidales bacterium]|nr:HTH domain-containing protein [Bacteroidales bacterium]